jgi:altronate dehydratase small subunit
MTLKALVLHPKDNVATAVCRLESGQSINVNSRQYILREVIPTGHKFALRDIEDGEKIIKYGEIIGQATARIKQGEHVHIHNVEGLRGRGDRR